jgi:hypothetical protein
VSRRSTRKVRALFLAALTSACNAQRPSKDWNGTWKLNPSKGNFHGPVFTISISADGEYRLNNNGKLDITFRCDGRDRPAGNERTRACVKSSPTVMELTLKKNGVKTTITHWELSPAGKTLSWTSDALRSNGPVVIDQFVASRISGSNDFVGQWLNMNYLQQHADLSLRLDNQTLHIAYPRAGQYVDAPFDGAEAPVHGPGPQPADGVTYSVRIAGRREFLILSKLNGKTLNQDSLELSRDGSVITESWWKPDDPASKGTLVYEKK